jgi:Spy/CpxP family protein refolding chaperone
MKMLSRVSRVSAAAAAMIVLAAAAYAQLPEGDHAKMGKNWEERFNAIIKELRITPEQQQAISQQRTQEKTRSQELRQKMKSVREEITVELNKEVTDTAKLRSLISRMKELTGERIEQQIKGILELKKILTPEQFKELNEKRQQNEKHKGGAS